jgi:DNA-binding CsgD family transcriptional regulator/PAS domain-containing protein
VAPAGTIQTDAAVMPRSELARTEFFQDFLRPQDIGGMLNAIVLMADGRQTHVTVHASRPIEDSQIVLYRLITPHLRRAAELNVQLAGADLTRAASAAVLDRLDQGVLFVDDASRVVFANRAADAMLSAGEGLRQSGGVLHGGSMSESSVLRAAISACGETAPASRRGSIVSLAREGRAPLSVRVSPAPGALPPWLDGRPAAILCVSDPDQDAAPPAEDLQGRFGLTRAQAALALEILHGDGIQAAAERLSITRATARTHLARIFEKTGTQRQSELVRVLLSMGLSMTAD